MPSLPEQALVDVNEELKKYLLHYCTSSVVPGFAVMLRGPWGSGKTWFVNSLRKSLSEIPDKRSLYVSLFGVTKPSDVTDQFFQQIHPVLASKAVQKSWSLAKTLIKGTLKFDLDGDGKDDGTLQINIPDLEKWASTAGAVLIFDDLERVGMPLVDILGYINQFVEHDGYRVIVIANEEKCIETTKGFPTIKEKVIGRTFEIKPNVELALDHFLNEIKGSSSVFEILNSRSQIILKVFERSEKRNLRSLRQATLDFDDLWRCLSEVDGSLSQRTEFLDKLVEDLYSLSIEYRAGELTIDVINDLKNSIRGAARLFSKTENREIAPTSSDLALDRHGLTIFTNFALLPVTYGAFFSRGYLNITEAKQGIERSQYLLDDETPIWQRLWYRNTLSDDEFVLLAKAVQREFIDLKYREEGEIFHVVGILLDLASKNLIAQSLERMLLICKSVVDILGKKRLIDIGTKSKEYEDFHDATAAYGMGFTGRQLSEFKDFSSYYFKARKILRKSALKKWAKEWIYELREDPDLWTQRITRSDNSVSWFINQPIFSFVSPIEFTRYLFQLSTPHIVAIAGALTVRYEFIGDQSDWRFEELDFWRKVEKILFRRLESAPKVRLSRYVFRDSFMSQLRAIIEKFEERQSILLMRNSSQTTVDH